VQIKIQIQHRAIACQKIGFIMIPTMRWVCSLLLRSLWWLFLFASIQVASTDTIATSVTWSISKASVGLVNEQSRVHLVCLSLLSSVRDQWRARSVCAHYQPTTLYWCFTWRLLLCICWRNLNEANKKVITGDLAKQRSTLTAWWVSYESYLLACYCTVLYLYLDLHTIE